MAVVMRMRWDGVTPEQYDEAKRRVGWEENPAEGGIFHHVVRARDDARRRRWGSPEVVSSTRVAVVQEIGIEGEPQVEISEAPTTGSRRGARRPRRGCRGGRRPSLWTAASPPWLPRRAPAVRDRDRARAAI